MSPADQGRGFGEQVAQRATDVVGALLVRQQQRLELAGCGQAQLSEGEEDLPRMSAPAFVTAAFRTRDASPSTSVLGEEELQPGRAGESGADQRQPSDGGSELRGWERGLLQGSVRARSRSTAGSGRRGRRNGLEGAVVIASSGFPGRTRPDR